MSWSDKSPRSYTEEFNSNIIYRELLKIVSATTFVMGTLNKIRFKFAIHCYACTFKWSEIVYFKQTSDAKPLKTFANVVCRRLGVFWLNLSSSLPVYIQSLYEYIYTHTNTYTYSIQNMGPIWFDPDRGDK